MVEKSQQIRLIDVLVLGPYLVWYAAKAKTPHREIIFGIGVLTILYNLQNYLANAREN